MFKTLIIILLIGSMAVNIFFIAKDKQKESSDFENLTKKYPYIAKRVLIEDPSDVLINFHPLREQLKDYTKQFGDSFTFYFEYLPTGVSIGINERTQFYSASLVKVPLTMAFLEYSRKQNLDLDQKIQVKKEELDSRFGDLWKIGEGGEVSLRKVLEFTLTASDNTAAQILLNRISKESYHSIFESLDIEIDEEEGQIVLTTKGYASILKALYFASILNKDDSNYILNLLTQTQFNDKLTASIPKEISVAHKIGVYFDNLVQQDCGIIYLPKRPYLLCMASQSDMHESNKRMQKVSEIIYKYMIQAEE